MSLVVEINKPKQVSQWVVYKDNEGNSLARFKVRGIGYKPYNIAIERVNNLVQSKGFSLETITPDDKQFHELLLEAAAIHLIEDWDGVLFKEIINGEAVTRNKPFTTDNAKKLLSIGHIGIVIWAFIKSESERIQEESDKERLEIMGKSETSTDTQNTTQKPKRKQPTQSGKQSTNIVE